MNENLKKIQDYLIKTGVSKERVEGGATSSVYLAMEIMEYAHRNQKKKMEKTMLNIQQDV